MLSFVSTAPKATPAGTTATTAGKVNLTFLRAAAVQARISQDKAVCLSVRPSVCPTHACIVTKRTTVLPTFLYHMKGQFIQFSDTKNGLWGLPVLREILGQIDPRFKNGDFQSIFARSASALRLSKKSSIITIRN